MKWMHEADGCSDSLGESGKEAEHRREAEEGGQLCPCAEEHGLDEKHSVRRRDCYLAQRHTVPSAICTPTLLEPTD